MHREEPRLFRSGFDVGTKSYATALQLTVDPHSGKVTNSQPKTVTGKSWVISRALWGSTMNWVFDPATIPADGLIPVTVHFNAECGPER